MACPIQATVGQQFRDDHNSTRIMELKDRGNDNPSSAHCAYLRQTFCSSEVLRHEKGISNEYQHLQNISYSHYATKQSLPTPKNYVANSETFSGNSIAKG